MRMKRLEINITREYLPYWEWEEVAYNMWGSAKDRKQMLEWAIEFTGDHEQYGHWMIRVVEQWPKSCKHNLSNITQNRKAWIGQAACALVNRCPEDIVRQAWGHLSEGQQILANMQADIAIKKWEIWYAEEVSEKKCA